MKTAFFNCFVTQIKGNLNCVMFLPMKLQFPLTYAIIGIGSKKTIKEQNKTPNIDLVVVHLLASFNCLFKF